METENRKYRGLMTVNKVVISRISGVICCLLLSYLFVSCVSMKSYREVKSNLIYQGLELEQYRYTLDSLKQFYGTFDKQLESKDQKIVELSKKIKSLEEEYDLLLEEYSREVN